MNSLVKNPSMLIILILASIAVLGFVGYASWGWSIGLYLLFASVIAGGSVFIFTKEVNLWINKRSDSTLNDKEVSWLMDNFSMLEHIPETQHTQFYKRVQLFKLDKEIISQDPQDRIYHPAVLLCGAYAAYFEMREPEVKVPFTNIPVYVFYGHAFPSPQYKSLHISEYFKEDGALLFSVPHMMKGNDDPKRFLNVALYESARVAMNGLFESVDYPTLEKLSKHGGYTVKKLEEYIGLERDKMSIKALALSLFFTDTKRFKADFPQLGDLFQEEFMY